MMCFIKSIPSQHLHPFTKFDHVRIGTGDIYTQYCRNIPYAPKIGMFIIVSFSRNRYVKSVTSSSFNYISKGDLYVSLFL